MPQPFRAIDGGQDWKFGAGRASYFNGEQAIEANIKTSVLFYLNDFFAAMDVGIDWNNLLGAKGPLALQNILLQTRQTIAKCEGVVRINSVNASVNPETRRATVTYSINTIYSQNVVGTIKPA